MSEALPFNLFGQEEEMGTVDPFKTWIEDAVVRYLDPGHDASRAIVRWTPYMANHVLENWNGNNRSFRRKLAVQAKGELESGNWSRDVDDLAFGIDDNGDPPLLFDGQHRLGGLAMMPDDFGVDIETKWNRPDTYRDKVDTGSSRTTSDILKFRGNVKDTAGKAAIGRALMSDAGQRHKRILADFVEMNDEALTAAGAAMVRFRNAFGRPFKRRKEIGAILVHLWLADPVLFSAFAEKLGSGDSPELPVGRLWGYMLRHDDDMERRDRNELFIRCWNDFHQGNQPRGRYALRRHKTPEPITVNGRRELVLPVGVRARQMTKGRPRRDAT